MDKTEKLDERICPICGHQRDGKYHYCRTCGWIFDKEEIEQDDPSPMNTISQRKYATLLFSIKEKKPGFLYEKDSLMFEEAKAEFMKANGINDQDQGWIYALPCPVCGEEIIRHHHDICSVCGWELDEIQVDDSDFWGGANILSLNDAKKAFASFREKDPSYRWEDDSSILHEKEDEMLPFYEEKEKSSSQ